MLLVSLWATYDIAFSLEKISGVVLGLGVFYAVVRIGQRYWGWALSFLAFLIAGVAVAAAGLLGVRWTVRFDFLAPIINRLPELLRGLPGAETGLQHNAVGGTLLWVLPCFLVLSISMLVSLRAPAKQSLSKTSHLLLWLLQLIFWLASLFVTAVLILTQSRGSYLALGLTAVVMLFILLPPRWRLIFGFALLLVGLTVVGALSRAGGWESFVELLGLSDQSGLSINTLEGRLEIWSRAIYGIQDFPFTGMGMNTFREVVHVLYPLFLIAPDKDIAHAHNEFLQAALDLGIPGLIAFVSIHIGAFWMLFDIWRKGKMTAFGPVEAFNVRTLNVKRTIVLGLGGGLAAHMLFGITDAITLGAKPGLLWWMLLGLIAGLHGQTMPSRKSASVE
jgi:putative inorganic carbon (HCO3(-)) transporter